jgi:fatty-acyl-CoA synthase
VDAADLIDDAADDGGDIEVGGREDLVILRAGISATTADLTAHVRTKIAGYKVPRDIDITVKLPKTSTGKIQKYMLHEKEWTGHAHRVQG